MKPKTQQYLQTCSTEPVTERCARATSARPTFTRPSAGASRRYVASKSKTNPGMLHQFQALKAPAADTARDRSETGGGGGAGRTLAGNMVEVSGAAQAAPVTTTRSRGGEIAGLTAGMSGRVFVLGKNQQPLMPCHPARARALLHAGRAVIHRRFPLVIRLTDRATGAIQPVVIKFDPGARTTGIAVARADATNSKRQHVLFTAELEHRGTQIRDSITQRAAFRRARRGRKTRYRAPRFENRGGDRRGWLPPSLRHRVETSASWSVRLRRFAPVSGVAIELVRFDTQFMQNSEISGVQYQQGELAGYEVREYLLEKWSRHCVYCDAEDTPLQIEHIVSKARGGSNRVSNLTLACPACNQAKGSRTLEEFLSHDPDRARQILARAKAPLASAATINATRFAMLAALRASGLPVKTGSGGRTKWNRSRFGLPKTHALDAACVGDVDILTGTRTQSLAIKCTGRGSRQRTRLTAQGFPRGYLSPAKRHFGFRTGDIVVATVPAGRKTGTHQGRVAVRASGSFNIQTSLSTVQGISHRHCRILQSADGYAYLQSQPCAASSCPVNGTGIRGVTV